MKLGRFLTAPLVAISLLGSACVADDPVHQMHASTEATTLRPATELDGTSWTLLGFQTADGFEPVEHPQVARIGFFDDRVGGFSGCNSYGGRFVIDGDNVSMVGLKTTMVYCPLAKDFEYRFLSILDPDTTGEISSAGHLVLSDQDGQALIFELDSQ